MTKKTFDSTAYKNAYAAQKYDRINLMLPKGLKDEIKQKAKGGSVNGYIVDAINEKMQKESSG